jgi:hypothetical protein
MPKIFQKNGDRFLVFKIPNFKKALSTLRFSKFKFPSFKFPKIASQATFFLGLLMIGLLAAIWWTTHQTFMNVTGDPENLPVVKEASSNLLETKPDVISETTKNAEFRIKAQGVVVDLTDGSTKKNYKAFPITIKEVIEGKKGDYFFVTLTNPLTKSPFYFKEGKYTLDELDSVFGESLSIFQKDVLDKVKVVGARVYIQGHADSLTASF